MKKMLANEELISVIVPIYKVEKYLKKCIDSILHQTYKKLEIILVDDGSPDDCGIICDEYAKEDSRIKVIHKENGGASTARNIGIDVAKGKYITFIDSDDEVEKQYIEYLYDLIKKYNTKMSIAAYTIVSKNGKKINIGDKYKEKNMKTEEALDRLLKEKGFTVSPCAKMFNKELFTSIRFPDGKLFEDNGTIYKFIMECDRIAYGNQSNYFYYHRENSSTTSAFNIKKFELIELTDMMCDEIEKRYPNLKETTAKKKITVRFSILRMINLNEDKKEILEKRNEIEKYIKIRKKEIIKNKNVDKRDKIALISLIINRRFFYFAWNVYCKIKY